jgi:type IX secretion system PorP/SprF family membrane protein
MHPIGGQGTKNLPPFQLKSLNYNLIFNGMKNVFTLLLTLIVSCSFAQDIHFSQYWAAPVAMNPAYTGKFNGLFRATFNYRNQWFTIPTMNSGSPYQTFQASVDGNVLPTSLGNNRLGVGAMFFNDKAGNGALQTNTGMVSIAYHQSVSQYGRSHLSFGIQAGVVNKRINFQDLIFETQLDKYGWNPSLPNGEQYGGKSILYPDVTIGAAFTSRPKDRFAFNFGYSLHHVASPRESFIGDQNNRLARRHVVQGGCEITAGYQDQWTISPVFLFMMQSNAQMYNLGVGVNYQTTNENIGIYGGAFYRVKDAAVLNLGVDVYNARIGISYDMNHSDLRGASKAQGAVELAIVYIFKKQNDPYIQYPSYCPKF